MVKFKRLDHIGMTTADIDRFIDFYTGILGFEVRERWKVEGRKRLKGVANLSLNAPNSGEDGSVLELFAIDPDEPDDPNHSAPAFEQTGFRLLALEVDDMDEAIEYLEGKGIKVNSAHPTNPARWFRDPDGNQIVFFPSSVYETYKRINEER
jgi:glyoxylase I family protein